jgi:hypothetical protein
MPERYVEAGQLDPGAGELGTQSFPKSRGGLAFRGITPRRATHPENSISAKFNPLPPVHGLNSRGFRELMTADGSPTYVSG